MTRTLRWLAAMILAAGTSVLSMGCSLDASAAAQNAVPAGGSQSGDKPRPAIDAGTKKDDRKKEKPKPDAGKGSGSESTPSPPRNYQ